MQLKTAVKSFVCARMASYSFSLSDDGDWLREPTTVAATPLDGPQLRRLSDPPQQRRSASSSIAGSSKRRRRRREATPEIDSADARVAEVDKNRNQDNAPPLKRRNYGEGLLHEASLKKQVVPTGRGNKNQMDRPAASSSSAVAALDNRSHGTRGAAVPAPQWRRLVKQELALSAFRQRLVIRDLIHRSDPSTQRLTRRTRSI